MHAVSNAINILNSSIDKRICTASDNGTTDTAKKCEAPTSSQQYLSKSIGAFTPSTDKATDKVGVNTSATVSNDVAGLTREEKGVVSSVFAKVIEGAEILEGRVRYIFKNIYINIKEGKA